MKKIMITIIIALLLVSPIILAEGEECDGVYLGTFQQYSEIALKQICDTCTYVTISTITFPNSTIINVDENMTRSGVNYNYSFSSTGSLGYYYYDVFGDKDNEIRTETFCFNITPSGFVGTIGFYVLILVLSLGIIILGYSVQDAWVVMLGAFGFVLFGLFVLFYGIDGLKDAVYTWGIGIITLMLGAYFLIRGALEQLDM